jgi:hypothetical protein
MFCKKQKIARSVRPCLSRMSGIAKRIGKNRETALSVRPDSETFREKQENRKQEV